MRLRQTGNFIKLLVSYIFSLLFREPLLWGSPAFASIEPTNQCNLRCPECPTGQRGLSRTSGSLSVQDFEKYINQLSPGLSWLTLYFQGEPYLNKDLFTFILYARKKNIHTWTSTNGHFLTDKSIRDTIASGLNKLVISLDGTDQQAYEQYRVGGSLQTVVEGIRNFVRIRGELGKRLPILEIQFLVLKSNQHQLKEIKKLGKSLGADRTVLKTAQFYDFEKGKPLMPEEGKWSRYKRTSGQADKRTSGQADQRTDKSTEGTRNASSLYTDAERFIVKNRLRNHCFRMWSGCVITWDGKVVPCCFDKDADHCLGDLTTQSFDEIWKGEKYREFRQKILKERKSVDICRNCSQKW